MNEKIGSLAVCSRADGVDWSAKGQEANVTWCLSSGLIHFDVEIAARRICCGSEFGIN